MSKIVIVKRKGPEICLSVQIGDRVRITTYILKSNIIAHKLSVIIRLIYI